jgi:signal transduction histidine kinase/CheY-like chemotaxis protein
MINNWNKGISSILGFNIIITLTIIMLFFSHVEYAVANTDSLEDSKLRQSQNIIKSSLQIEENDLTLNPNAQEQIREIYKKSIYIIAVICIFVLLVMFFYYRKIKIKEQFRKEIEEELKIAEEARQFAEESAQKKLTFLARMSHEIRTPMNGVLGMAEALTYTEINNHQQELLGTLKSSAGNLLALLNDVLDFSKMDAGKLTLETVPVNLHQLSRNIINSFQQLTSNELELNYRVADNITHNYLTDPTRMFQVLNNLISNAIKFTEKGTVTLTIDLIESNIKDEQTIDVIRVSVKDTGIGIPAKHQASLFTPFKQADDAITRKYGGTGLGLSICQEIATAMNSHIQLESVEHEGSHFYFDLSLIQSGVESDTEDRRKNKRVVNPPNDNRFENLRVLIAEDNIVNLKVLTAQLERLNISPHIAQDGAQALKMHNELAYDIIISDCHMPILDGFELASTISKQEHEKPIWLIAITADSLDEATEKCISSGFDDYMSKPCPQEVITNKLNNAYRQLMKKQTQTSE